MKSTHDFAIESFGKIAENGRRKCTETHRVPDVPPLGKHLRRLVMSEMEDWMSPLLYKGKYVPYLPILGMRIVGALETKSGFFLIVDNAAIEKKLIELVGAKKWCRSSILRFYYIPSDLSGAEWYETSVYWWTTELADSVATGTYAPIELMPEHRILNDTTLAFRAAGQRRFGGFSGRTGLQRFAKGWYTITFHEDPPRRHLGLPIEFEAMNTGWGMRRHVQISQLREPPPAQDEAAAASPNI